MDANEPLVEIAVDDMTQVPAMRYKDFAAFFNPFISHTVKFLNRFACVCEEKLADLSLRIQGLEITISLLETKLSSIPGLEDVTVNTPEPSQPPTVNQQVPSVAPQLNQSQPPESTEQATTKEAKTVADDPRYGKYFKMLKVGVPVAAIRGKVLAEGLDPDLLENPDAPMPGGGANAEDDDDDRSIDEGSSASSFSDDE
eukprot:gene5434-609_t